MVDSTRWSDWGRGGGGVKETGQRGGRGEEREREDGAARGLRVSLRGAVVKCQLTSTRGVLAFQLLYRHVCVAPSCPPRLLECVFHRNRTETAEVKAQWQETAPGRRSGGRKVARGVSRLDGSSLCSVGQRTQSKRGQIADKVQKLRLGDKNTEHIMPRGHRSHAETYKLSLINTVVYCIFLWRVTPNQSQVFHSWSTLLISSQFSLEITPRCGGGGGVSTCVYLTLQFKCSIWLIVFKTDFDHLSC